MRTFLYTFNMSHNIYHYLPVLLYLGSKNKYVVSEVNTRKISMNRPWYKEFWPWFLIAVPIITSSWVACY